MTTQSRKLTSIWGALAIIFGTARMVWAFYPFGVWVWTALLVVSGIGAFGVYLTEHSDWTLLIPSYTLWTVAGLLVLLATGNMPFHNAALYVLPAIGVPFVVTWLRNRRHWWALIPAYVMLSITGLLLFLHLGLLNGLAIAAYVLLGIALPFFVVYVTCNKRWALIPGGVIALTGLSLLAFANPVASAVVAVALGVACLLPSVSQQTQLT